MNRENFIRAFHVKGSLASSPSMLDQRIERLVDEVFGYFDKAGNEQLLSEADFASFKYRETLLRLELNFSRDTAEAKLGYIASLQNILAALVGKGDGDAKSK